MVYTKKITAFLIAATFLIPHIAHAQTAADYTPDEYYKGVVTHIIKEDKKPESGRITQLLDVKLTSGPDNGKTVQINYGDIDGIASRQKAAVGNSIVVLKVPDPTDASKSVYYLSDFNRTPWLLGLVLFFFLAAVLSGGWRGLTSLSGLISTIAILLFYVMPQIMAGGSPTLIVLIGGTAIILVSMFFAHGFNKQTTVAVVSTFATLVFSIGFAALAVKLSQLFGTGSEEAMYIQLNNAAGINLQGVLLGGIIIGTIGVLDDVTTAQTAAANEISDARPGMHFTELFKRVMRVGREHIASLVNTLVLAYAGASFPLLLLMYATKDVQPLWVVLNSQQMAEEIVRTLVGSTTLVLAVPLSSALAAWYYTRHNHKTI